MEATPPFAQTPDCAASRPLVLTPSTHTHLKRLTPARPEAAHVETETCPLDGRFRPTDGPRNHEAKSIGPCGVHVQRMTLRPSMERLDRVRQGRGGVLIVDNGATYPVNPSKVFSARTREKHWGGTSRHHGCSGLGWRKWETLGGSSSGWIDGGRLDGSICTRASGLAIPPPEL